ncbi:hypothetical protein [Galactobacillus timonensis]|uniref:hypothetical protein n=1 Tax=Galactobacillus timonensis TaxID=2041840 RepID=UPI0023EF77F3|nr:hypothetical protein [Galactobacillus timonensis]MCI6754270.1 hypothetical protein [Galactobacillus timonensis]MDD7087109.1 hypothetical protein [Galactobacillus timonensis]
MVISIIAGTRSINPEIYARYPRRLSYESIPLCGTSELKTYMDYRTITDETSNQYSYIRQHMLIDRHTGLLYDGDGFIGVALGYSFGAIGTRYYFILDSGITLPVVKIEEKDPKDAPNGCTVDINGSILEFVIDADRAASYFGTASNNLVLQGNFNNDPRFAGSISEIDRVLD